MTSVDERADPRRRNNTWDPWIPPNDFWYNNAAVDLAALTYCAHIGAILVLIVSNVFI